MPSLEGNWAVFSFATVDEGRGAAYISSILNVDSGRAEQIVAKMKGVLTSAARFSRTRYGSLCVRRDEIVAVDDFAAAMTEAERIYDTDRAQFVAAFLAELNEQEAELFTREAERRRSSLTVAKIDYKEHYRGADISAALDRLCGLTQP